MRQGRLTVTYRFHLPMTTATVTYPRLAPRRPAEQALEFFYREEKWRRLSLTLGDSLRTVPRVRVGGSGC